MNFPTLAERRRVFLTIKYKRLTKCEISKETGINMYLTDFYIKNLLFYGLVRTEGRGPGTRYIATMRGINEEGDL